MAVAGFDAGVRRGSKKVLPESGQRRFELRLYQSGAMPGDHAGPQRMVHRTGRLQQMGPELWSAGEQLCLRSARRKTETAADVAGRKRHPERLQEGHALQGRRRRMIES